MANFQNIHYPNQILLPHQSPSCLKKFFIIVNTIKILEKCLTLFLACKKLILLLESVNKRKPQKTKGLQNLVFK